MSKRIPAKFKEQLGKALGKWYRLFGEVQPRRPYREDDEGDEGSAVAKPLFIEHPFLAEMPIGASSDLTTVIENNADTISEAKKRSDELSEELQNRLSFELNQEHRKRLINENHLKPRPF